MAKGKAKENVENFGDQGLLSKDLATIKIDVPVEFSFDEMEYTGPDEEKVKALFEELLSSSSKYAALTRAFVRQKKLEQNPCFLSRPELGCAGAWPTNLRF